MNDHKVIRNLPGFHDEPQKTDYLHLYDVVRCRSQILLLILRKFKRIN